jgi:hypothetical protein
MNKLNNTTAKISSIAQSKLFRVINEDRGDVPGWVLVTVMTAGLVVALWSIADGQLKSVLQNAIRSVSSP